MKTYDPSMRNLKPMVRTYDEAARPDMLVMPDLARLDAVAERARTIEDALCEATLSVTAGAAGRGRTRASASGARGGN